MKKIISFFVSLVILCSVFTIPAQAGSGYKDGYTEITIGENYQKRLTLVSTHRYCFTAPETQYYKFYFCNQSVEVRTGIGFVDGFANLFVGSMSIAIYDQFEKKLTNFSVRCGYETTSTLQLEKDQKYYFDVGTTVEGNYKMKVSMLADIGANTWDKATEVLPSHQIKSAIDAFDDEDWFCFTTDEDLSFYNYALENIQGDSSIRFYLYEFVQGAGDTPLREITNFSVSKNSTNSKNLKLKQRTKYYIRLYMPSGNKCGYILDSTQRVDACGDTREAAYPTNFEKTYTTSFDGDNDADFFSFTTTDCDTYYDFVFNPLVKINVYFYMNLYDESGNEIFTSRFYYDTYSKSVKLDKNKKYYLYLYSPEPTNYNITINVKEDKEGNTKEEALSISINTKYNTSFDGADDIDYFSFTTSNYEAYYSFNFTPLTKINVYFYMNLYDESGSEIFTSRFYYDTYSKSVKLDKNKKYYLYLYSPEPTNYNISISIKKDYEGNTKDEAKSIKVNQLVECGFEGEDDEDWFKVNVSNDGNYRLVMINESCRYDPYIYIYNTRDKELGYSYSSSSIWLDTGTYYLKASPTWSADGYYSIVLANCGSGHKEANKYRPAGYKTDGTKIVYCKCCQQEIRKETIAGIASVSLKSSSLTYTGSVVKPTIVVKDTNGNTIKPSYDLSYSDAKHTNVGTYKVKVTFKGAYQYTKTLTFKVIPKATSISSLSAKSKGFAVKWKKQATQTTGYEIQYSTSSSFASSKTKTVVVSSNKTTSKTISKLKGKTKYYVRIRTYKTVSGTKYYSSWSGKKSITTKK